jgi:hypothetical protein
LFIIINNATQNQLQSLVPCRQPRSANLIMYVMYGYEKYKGNLFIYRHSRQIIRTTNIILQEILNRS